MISTPLAKKSAHAFLAVLSFSQLAQSCDQKLRGELEWLEGVRIAFVTPSATPVAADINPLKDLAATEIGRAHGRQEFRRALFRSPSPRGP